ncbi:MAG: sugar-phosphate kinase [Elusimicrobia bacterium CG_4_10_14_0_8_um_filter_37_32]|nr:MAG: sugar-phosphate kinase [Elusimicrobia bacterium CG_4_10_14_0_8_um_filter_37_32]
MNKPSIRDLLKTIWVLEEKEDLKITLLGIGPMSERVVKATLELGEEEDFPVIFIASRNQVDKKEWGAGYVEGWDQKEFVTVVGKIAKEINFSGLYYICRDHGGPWQRTEERREKVSEKEAMKRAKDSYLADILAGFDLLHIDLTLNPLQKEPLPLEEVRKRIIEMIDWLETKRKEKGLPPVGYEVGTEETKGGLINPSAFEQFLKSLLRELNSRNLPKPDFIVGQTGTLVKMDRNVGQFNPKMAKELATIAKKYKVGFKEHNADYLSEEILTAHPNLGITAANVAPEFGVAETKTYLRLAKLIPQSDFIPTIQRATLESNRWRRWLTKEDDSLTAEEIAKDRKMLNRITIVAGHYTFSQKVVTEAQEELFRHLKEEKITENPQREVVQAIKDSIRNYIRAFNLKGLTTILTKNKLKK